MSDVVIVTSIVCVSIVGIVAIFAILAYLKDKATFSLKNRFKNLNSEIAITAISDKEKNSKK